VVVLQRKALVLQRQEFQHVFYFFDFFGGLVQHSAHLGPRWHWGGRVCEVLLDGEGQVRAGVRGPAEMLLDAGEQDQIVAAQPARLVLELVGGDAGEAVLRLLPVPGLAVEERQLPQRIVSGNLLDGHAYGVVCAGDLDSLLVGQHGDVEALLRPVRLAERPHDPPEPGPPRGPAVQRPFVDGGG
jgi:hypothetical protein